MRSVSLILATDLKDLTIIGVFDFLEWSGAHIVATIRRRLRWIKPWYGEREEEDDDGRSSDKTT